MAKTNKKRNNIFKEGGILPGVLGMATNTLSSGLSNSNIKDTSSIENSIEALNNKSVSAVDNNSLMQEWGSFSPLQSISSKDLLGSNNVLQNTLSGAASGAALGPWGAVAGAAASGISSLVGRGIAKNKARNKANSINTAIGEANNRMFNSFVNRANTIASDNNFNMMSNFAAYGGNIESGPFSGDFTNGITYINNGGTHEENPFEGVPVGVDSNGIPNLVEEGEVIYNNYVFSNRLNITKELLDQVGLQESLNGKTFSDAVKTLSQEIEERPNDPISKKGFEDSIMKLQQAQETLRTSMGKSNTNIFKDGGKKNNYIDSFIDNHFGAYSNFYTPKDTNSGTFLGNFLNSHFRNGLQYPTNTVGLDMDNINLDYLLSDTNNNKKSTRTTYDPIPNINHNVDLPYLLDTNNNIKLSHPDGVGNNTPKNSGNFVFDDTMLRYAPVVAGGIASITDALGLTNKPDYSNIDTITSTASSLPDVSYKPIGNYMEYNPFDINYYTNKLGAQSGASRRAILNNSAGNRGIATAGILASDYNTLNQMGDLFRQAEEFNVNQKQQVENFNRGTNQANSQMDLQAQSMNLNNNSTKINAAIAAANMKNNIDAASSNARTMNLTNFIDSIGNIGTEAFNRNMINSNPAFVSGIGKDGNIYYKKSKGGYLTVGRKK